RPIVADAERRRGLVIVGRFRQPAFRGDYRQYFVWTEQDGMRDLTDIIRDAAGVELDEYSGVHDIFVSGDGRVIAGTVFNSDLDPRTRSFVFELSTSCPADVNGDGQLSPNDFNAWILAYNSSNPACDQNGDGECRQNDFNAWILNFNAGC
ncbi:MAG: GC-type dockerin domain-anchored protein, partial [Planctomycetota bacterium]